MDLERPNYEQLSDKDLIQLFCSDPPDQKAFDELWKRHEVTIRRYSRHMGYMCPHFYSPQLFIEEVFSRTQEKVFRSLRGFEGRATFSTWLWQIIEGRAIEYRRKLLTRGRAPVRDVVDLTEAELVKSYAAFHDKLKQDPLRLAIVGDRKMRVREILLKYASSQEGFDSLRAVLLCVVDDCSIAEIARRFFTYDRKINDMLAHDYLALKNSFAEAGIRSLEEI